MTKKHITLPQTSAWCSVKGNSTCACGNDYRDVCKKNPKVVEWGQVPTSKSSSMGPEAHHLLSVSEVNQYPPEPPKKAAVKRVLKKTDWCINAAHNMIALPTFGHTVIHYMMMMKKTAPPFKNLPQHNFDHNGDISYCTEVGSDILDLWRDIEVVEKAHPADPEVKIKKRLENLSTKWRKALKARGSDRGCGGTHESWKDGVKNPDGKWYLNFSMASNAGVTKRYFPLPNFDDEVIHKYDQIVTALG